MNTAIGKKKGFGSLAVLLALLFLLAACGGAAAADININDSLIADYVYLPLYIDLPELGEHTHVQGSIVHGDRIFYYYIDHHHPAEDEDWETWTPIPPSIVVASVLADGTDPQQIHIPASGDSADIAGLHITEAGNLALILIQHEWDMRGANTTLLYVEYDMAGNELVSQEIEGVVPPDGSWFHVDGAFFADDGSIVLTTWTDRGGGISFLDSERSLRGQIESDSSSQGMIQMQDGAVMALDWEMDGDRFFQVLREIDFAAGDWGRSISLTAPNVRNLFPAGAEDPFDLLIDDGHHLFGYNLETGERTLILNWVEAGLAADWGYHVGFLADGRVSVLVSNWDSHTESQRTELLTLTRTPRAEVPEREIISLGGLWLSGEMRAQVVDFNRNSLTHQIQVKDYTMYNTTDDWEAGRLRFRAELAAGQGPDIIWGGMNEAVFMDRGLLLDLYPFIDADPEINRSDFFPNILDAMEAADGTLPMISNSFALQTMIGTTDAVGHMQSWAISDMLALLEATDDAAMAFILGEWMTGESFLSHILSHSGTDFINWAEREVNLDTEAFIHLLEIAARLPNDWEPADDFVDEFTRMRRGEQLLAMASLWGPESYQDFPAALGDITVLGVPTREGGAHVVQIWSGMGISAASQQQDAAWSFIRQNLLSEARSEWGAFPLRIDLYEEAIAEIMTPHTRTDEDGNEIEVPRFSRGFGDGLMIDVYAMTEEEARDLRAIVESASLMGRFDEVILDMVREEILPFFAGDRAAADTARILQNRIQTYLNEQR